MKTAFALSSQAKIQRARRSKTDAYAASAGTGPSQVPKVQATADLAMLKSILEKMQSLEFKEACIVVASATEEIAKDADSLDGVSREALLRSALDLYNGKDCPVCETSFEPDAFRNHIAEKLKHLEEITTKRKALELQINPLMDVLHTASSTLATVIGYGAQLNPPVNVIALKEFNTILTNRYEQLHRILPINDTHSVLLAAHKVPNLTETIITLEAGIDLIPKPTQQDEAREFLVLAQERLEKYQTAKQRMRIGKSHAERALKVLNLYADALLSG